MEWSSSSESWCLQVILNSGVWGGRKEAVQDILAGMVSEFTRLYLIVGQKKQQLANFNMAVLNTVVLQQAARTWRIFTGRPFCAGQVSLGGWKQEKGKKRGSNAEIEYAQRCL